MPKHFLYIFTHINNVCRTSDYLAEINIRMIETRVFLNFLQGFIREFQNDQKAAIKESLTLLPSYGTTRILRHTREKGVF